MARVAWVARSAGALAAAFAAGWFARSATDASPATQPTLPSNERSNAAPPPAHAQTSPRRSPGGRRRAYDEPPHAGRRATTTGNVARSPTPQPSAPREELPGDIVSLSSRLAEPPQGDVRRAVFARLADERSPTAIQTLVACLRRHALCADERGVLLRCAQQLDVPFDRATPCRDPARLARRMVYEELAADAVLRDDWEPLLARVDAAPTENEGDDVIAGFAVLDQSVDAPDPGPVGSPERAALLATRRAHLEKFFRTTRDLSCRRRLVDTAFLAFGALAGDSSKPADEVRASTELVEGLVGFETDPATIGALRGALSRIKSPRVSGDAWTKMR